MEKTTAIVLRSTDFSETSSILTLFTRDFGKVQAIAKGARRPKSQFESALDLLGVSRVVLLRKTSDTLDILTEAKLESRFNAAQSDLSSLYAGYYLAELLRELTDQYDSHPELFDLTEQALLALCQQKPISLVVLHFELNMLHILGHFPSIEQCVGCGTQLELSGSELTKRIAFGQIDGGVLCNRCRPGKRQVVSVTAAALFTMKNLITLDDPAGEQEQFELRTLGELRGLMTRYISHLIGHEMKMHRYMGMITKN